MYKCVRFVYFSYTEIIDIIFLKCTFSIILAAMYYCSITQIDLLYLYVLLESLFSNYLLLIYDWISYLSLKTTIKTAFLTNLIS